MQPVRLLRLAAATAAAVVAVSTMAAAPALAAKPVRTPVLITSHPDNPTTDKTATFTWTGPGSTFKCSLDGAAGTSCASGQSYSNLADGQHTFTVRSNPPRPSSARYTWVVDTTAPAVPTITQVNTPTRSTTANVYFSSDATAETFHCWLDGAAQADPCTSPLHVSGLTEGDHYVEVSAEDQLGNTSNRGRMDWTVDSTAPMNVLVDVDPLVNVNHVDVTFSADGAVSYTCSVDNAAPTDCVSPLAVTDLSEGQHSIAVVAQDSAGNASWPGTAAWTVDLTPPATPTFLTGPADPTDQELVSFVLAEGDPTDALWCSVDGAAAALCPSSLQFDVPAYAGHTLDVYAVDRAGNQGEAARWSWTRTSGVISPVDITSGPNDPSNVKAPEIFFEPTGSNTADYECSLTGEALALGPVTCDPGVWPFADLAAEGEHVFSVVAVDATSDSKSSPATWTWTADFTAPALSFSTAPSAETTDTTAVFSFPQEPGATYTCSLDGAAAVACASPVTYRDLVLGGHSLVLSATDLAGNASQVSPSWTVVAPSTPTDPGTPSTPSTPSTPTSPTQPTQPATPSSPAAPGVTVTLTPSTGLRGVSTAGFSRDVHGVSASTVTMTVAGTTTSVAVALSCANGSGAAVDCATGAVRTVSVQPRAALVPGQSYRLATTTGVLDAAQKPVPAAESSFRASTDEQETSLRAASRWAGGKAKAAYGKRYVTESRKGATITFAFRGKKVTWYTMTGASQGRAKVLVDGVKKAKVNNYSAATAWRVARTIKGLAKGNHQLTIVVLGRKGAKSGTGTSVAVDALRVGKKLTVNPKGVARWGLAKVTGASAGGYTVSNAKGATSSFTFRGTSVSWVTQTAPTMGKAKVYVDGVLKAKLDNFSKKSRWNVRRTVTGLADRVHTVKIKVLGTKRPKATGTDVVVDRWLVG